jgi:hypothetical protein
MMFGRYDYVADERYYLPVVPLSVFAAYSIATTGEASPNSVLLRVFGRPYLAGYVMLTLVYVVFMLTPTQIGATERSKLMASNVYAWPSFAVAQELSPSRRLIIRLLKEKPDALLLTSQMLSFSWDPAVDNSKVFTLSCYLSSVTRVTGPVRIVIHSYDAGQPEELWHFSGDEPHGRMVPATCFAGLPNIHLIQRFPDERFKVLEADVPAGERIVFNR